MQRRRVYLGKPECVQQQYCGYAHVLCLCKRGRADGEAGPEAIMPLTRAADGSLGVRAVGSMNGSAGLVYSPVYHIAIQNDGTNGQIGPEAAGSLVQLIDQRVQAVMLSMRRDGGMLSG